MADEKRTFASETGNIVLSSRVRIIRNADGIPFPARLNANEKKALAVKIISVLEKEGAKLNVIDMSSLYPYEAVALAERHLISPEFASRSEGRILLLSEDEKISIMINEEDHLRIQAVEKGLAPERAYVNVSEYEDILDAGLHFAFDARLGFLNQNPGDLGNGMRASVLMHLPALSKTGGMSRFASMISKLGMNIRGSYGDAASVKGDIYRLSNSLCMGLSEKEAIANLKSLAMQISTKERAAAESFVKDIGVKDRINRAMGLLSNAVLLSSDEMMEMLSWVRLGALYGLNGIDPEIINELFITMQPANINVACNGRLSSVERDEIRAKYVREKLCAE